MPSVRLSPLFNGQTVTPSGAPAAGYRLWTYAAGSSSQLATYTTSAGTVAQSNPVTLDANGFPENPIWLQTGLSYKLVLKDANDVVIRTEDNISGVNDASASVSQWQVSGVTPSYVSASSFTVPGDQTSEFHVGRRLQFTTNAGDVYGTILTSAYTSLTTVAVLMDGSSALDSGLSAVNLSLLRADNPAVPNGITHAPRTVGLAGNVNASTPLTKYDLSAGAVTMRNAAGVTVTRFNTGTLTCDLGLAGPARNGRDQAAAFPANSWVHLYTIWNGTSLATIASLSPPTVGPALPSGDTHWCYDTTIRWNGSSNIVPTIMRGSVAYIDVAEGSARALSAGTATAYTAVSCASFVPPVALRAQFRFAIVAGLASAGGIAIVVRPTGASGGITLVRARSEVASSQVDAATVAEIPLNTSQQIDYKFDVAPASGGAYIDVLGYVVPNGDA